MFTYVAIKKNSYNILLSPLCTAYDFVLRLKSVRMLIYVIA